MTGTLPSRPDPGSAGYAARVLAGSLSRASAAGLGLALICVIAGAALSASAPAALKRLVDDLGEGVGSAVMPALVYGSCLGLARLAGEARAWLFGRAEQDMVRSLSLRAARHVLSLRMQFFLERSSGSLVQTIENGLTGYRLLLQHSVFTLLPGLVEIALIALLVLHFLDAAFLGVLLVCAALYAAVFAGGARKVLAASRDVSAARIGVTSRLADSLLNIETVKAFGGEDALARRLDIALLDTRRSWRRFYSVRWRNGVLVALIFTCGMMTVLLMSLAAVRAGEMTPGGVVLISAYMLQIVRPMEMLGFAARDIGQGAAFIELLTAVLSEAPEASASQPAVKHAPPSGPMAIRLDGVSFAHRSGAGVLRSVTIDIAAGMKVGLVGVSGSGKSTLIRLLAGLFEPSAGQILIDGAPIADMAPDVLRRQIAFIPQAPGLFNDRVEFNVGFPEGNADALAVQSVLARVRMTMQDGPGNPAGEGGRCLSGGERQRIAIARALLRHPRLVLADEPTSALDAETETAVLQELDRAFAGATMILATHRLRAVRNADLILVLSGGRILESGTHDTLMARSGAYARMWKSQKAG